MAEVMSSKEHLERSEPAAPRSPRKWVDVVVISLLVLTAAAMYAWRWQSLEALSRSTRQERSELLALSRAALTAQGEELLRLSALPLAWSIRPHLMQGNFAEVDGYLQQLVKQPHVVRIAVADQQGTVRVSTDRKFDGATLAQSFPWADAATPDPTVGSQDGELRVVVPVLGLESRLGTLVLTWDEAASQQRLPQAH